MTAAKRPSSAKFFFLKQFLRDPKSVGSVIPTSRAAIRGLLHPIDWTQVRCVVEYGPGTGVFTRELLARLGKDAVLIAIDTSPVFIAHLRRAIHDKRLICAHGSATDVEAILARLGFAQAGNDIIGLPFSTLPHGVADAIMDATARAVRPGGAFLIYQYSRFVLPMLRQRFEQVQRGKIWRCIPPAHLFWAWQGKADVNRAAAESSIAA